MIKYVSLIVFIAMGAWSVDINRKQHNEIVSLQLDLEEVKQHTNILAGKIKIQDYQIEVLTHMNEK